MAERRRGLGRGLGALIPSAAAADSAPTGTENEPASTSEAPKGEAEGQKAESPAAPKKTRAAASKKASEDKADGGKKSPAKSAAEQKAPTKKSESAAKSDSVAKSTENAAERPSASATAAAPAATTTDGDVSRETPSSKRRAVTPEARQSAMRSRLDMGSALRARPASSRPSDMFFTPSAASADSPDEAVEAAEKTDSPVASSDARTSEKDVAPRGAVVSRETGAVPDERPAVSRETSAPSPDSDAENLASVPGATFAEVKVGDIHPNRKQPRQVFDEEELAELAYSIGELGVLQPIVVRPSRETDGPAYELVMGERRWRATQRAGLETVPAIIRDTADDDLLRDALLENLHRSQLNPLEEAAAYQQLLQEFGATQEELSKRIGRSRPQISNTLRLMKLPPLVQRRVAAGVLSAGHARALLALEDPAEMERLAQRIVAEGMSVRAAEEAASLSKRSKTTRRAPSQAQERHRERLNYIAEAFTDKLDTTVKIDLGARKGRMTIEFASVDDLNRIISVLDPQAGPEQS